MTASFMRRSRLRWVNQLILPDRKEWNEVLVRQIFHSFDADEICKIPIPRTTADDCIAWHYEKNGNFSVTSAYRLAASIQGQTRLGPSSSSGSVNVRSIWDLIWKADVPPKVRIFGWRVATNTLATQSNKCKRTIVPDATCVICGNVEEDEFHAVIACSKSRALRHALRDEWRLPAQRVFRYTGCDWLQILLDSVPQDIRAKILLLLWRCWHMRDDCVHGDGKESVRGSVLFLHRYVEEWENATLRPHLVSRGQKTRVTSPKGKSSRAQGIPPPTTGKIPLIPVTV